MASDVGRTGLLIHGGDSGPNGKLRPTNGCIRLSNSVMQELVNAIVLDVAIDGPPEACSVQELPVVEVSKPDPAADSGYNEGAPPPNEASTVILN